MVAQSRAKLSFPLSNWRNTVLMAKRGNLLRFLQQETLSLRQIMFILTDKRLKVFINHEDKPVFPTNQFFEEDAEDKSSHS